MKYTKSNEPAGSNVPAIRETADHGPNQESETMRTLTEIRLLSSDFADITGTVTYRAWSKMDKCTYDFSWPAEAPAPVDGLILGKTSLRLY